jgi:hypothetical protein
VVHNEGDDDMPVLGVSSVVRLLSELLLALYGEVLGEDGARLKTIKQKKKIRKLVHAF